MSDKVLGNRYIKKPLVLDGGFGQLINDRYSEIDMSKELWASGIAVRFPEIVKDVHLMYLRAGCDIISTATYQASLSGYKSSGLAADIKSATDLMAETLALAVDAREQYLQENPVNILLSSARPLIAVAFGSIGATMGNCSEYTGSFGNILSSKDIYDFHKQRLLMLHTCLKTEKLDKQIDLVAIETIPSLQEALSIVDALRNIREQGVILPDVWISFSARSEECIGSGELIQDAVKITSSCSEVSAVGVNCVSVDIVNALLRKIKHVTCKPVVCYPNGQTWQGSQELWNSGSGKITPDQFARRAMEWIENGADIVGGCCKTTPEHIKSLSKEILRVYNI